MSRTTIDFGIDLGTTNSAIAVMRGVGTEIIKNNADTDITPSAVSIDKKGAVLVGLRAKNKIEDNPDDAYVEFKRRMGTDFVYHFKSAGQDRKPEELSSEVLKSLRADVQQRTGEIVESSVVTVPAAFELHQCDATRKAAQLAGFKDSPLLQEPVAAALAYGFQADQQQAYWLVYDFGGGTFDAAVIKSDEGTINVVNHGGDNFLGGSDIDWAIVEKLVVPRLLQEYPLEDFSRGNKLWRQAFAKLKRAAEIAKIDLSRSEQTTLETCRFVDASGEQIEFECDLTRGELIEVAEPIITKSTDICARVLHEKNLSREAVERVILVGGPTLAPYFRQMLAVKLGIQLDHSVDPLTVVARGAAVFAGTQKFTSDGRISVPAGEFAVEMAKSYKPVGTDTAPIAGGKISGPSTSDFTGFTLELVNAKSLWRSGRISLRADGVFIAHLHAERGERNHFVIELHDPTGRLQKTTPDRITYTVGSVVEEQPLINSMGLALANNQYDRLFEKGRGLPLKASRNYRTTHAIRQGQSGELIKIPIIEGENELADRNRLIDTFLLEAGNITRDLPAASEIEVTLRIDESRIITATAYVPLLDHEFTKKIELRHKGVSPDFLQQDFEAELKRFKEVKARAEKADGSKSDELMQEVEDSQLMKEVRAGVAAAKGDPDAAAKCEKQLLALKLKLDEAANALEWPALVAQAQDWLRDLDDAAGRHGTPAQRARAGELVRETNDIIAEHKMDRLRNKIDQMSRLYWEMIFSQPGYWVNQFQQMEKQVGQMRDQGRATKLMEQGRDCLSKNNIAGLQNIVRQLWDLLPRNVAENVQRGYQSGLVR